MKKLIAVVVLGLILRSTTSYAEPVIILDRMWAIGSGTVIYSNNNITTILTARHVCEGNQDPSAMAFNRSPVSAAVIAIHIKEDLCLMTAVGKFKPTKLATSFDYAEERAFVLSLFPGPIERILLELDLVGPVYEPKFGHYMAFDGIVYPGMSGSSILNERGELIGVLIIGTSDSLHGGYVELPYIYELLNGVDSATVNVYRTQAID